MTLDSRLIAILADGAFHSGEELGERFGISRTAVWKQLQKLQELTGLAFESVKGRGYRLPGGIELLDQEAILSPVSTFADGLLASISLHDQVDSTNRLAMEQAQAGAPRGTVIFAEQQLAGRGRRGRSWISPFGCNIYCSVVWEFNNGAAALEGLSLAVGVAVAKALGDVGVADLELKWPNDVMWQGRKLAGILLEMTGDAAGRCQVIVGIGINVAMTSTQAAVVDQPWCDVITAAGRPVSRNRLAGCLLSHLLPLLAEFEREGFAGFQHEWSLFDRMQGKQVVIHFGDQMVFGVAAGVGENGALGVDTELGRQWFHGGEVSLRLQN